MSFCHIQADGTQGWYSDPLCTILHREDGPALVKPDMYVEWYINGKLHREDGPASIVGPDLEAPTYQAWYQNGVRHRADGPAAILAGEGQYWYQNGEFHRLNGPAIELAGEVEYWIEGKLFSKDEYYTHPEVLKYRNTISTKSACVVSQDVLTHGSNDMVGTVQFRYGDRVFDESPLYSGEALFGPEILARATRAMTMLRSPQDPRPEILQLCERVLFYRKSN